MNKERSLQHQDRQGILMLTQPILLAQDYLKQTGRAD
jgi:hypothetical protein